MMHTEQAMKFTEEWISAWNKHDIEAILFHYSEEIKFSSPLIQLLKFNNNGVITNKSDLKEYFQIGLNAYPDLNFKLRHYFAGVDSIVILYTSVNGIEAAEVFRLNEQGKATDVFCHYSN